MSFLTVKVDMSDWGLDTKLARAAAKAEHAVAQIAEQDTKRYVPMLNGVLRKDTKVIDNMIVYPAPYARYLYYGKYMVDSRTGKGPMLIKDKDGNELIRYHKHARLKPTNRDLVLAHTQDPDATAHWFEVSKAQNLQKWKRTAKEALIHDFDKR